MLAECWFVRRLRAQVRRAPQAIAVESAQGRLSYAELWRRSGEWARALRQRGLGAEHLIALEVSKSLEYVVAVVAVWRAGAAFLPLDPGLGRSRCDQFASLSRCDLRWDGCGPLPERCWSPHPDGGSERLAYVIYTSGSSGVPKGVEVTHRGLPNLFRTQMKAFQVDSSSRLYWLLSIQFDASLSDLGCALLAGACLCLPQRPLEALPEDLEAQGITHFDVPPALLRAYRPEDFPASLTHLICGGEASPPEVLRGWARQRRVVQVYGPTEASICTSLVSVGEDWSEPRLGRTVRSMKHHLDGEELLISGPGLARGYRGQEDLTRERFVVWQGRRCYRSGDRVAACGNGDFVFLGRLDRQFKLNGKLIEPAEIEGWMLEVGGVERAAVLVRGQQLVGFWKGPAPLETLRAALESRPAWMVPQRWLQLAEWPTTASGKTDFAALPQLREGWLPDRTLREQGATSLQIVEMLTALRRRGVELDGCALWDSRPADLERSRPPLSGWVSTEVLEREVAQLPGARVQARGRGEGSILVTGAGGFLGRHLLSALRAAEPGRPCLGLVRRRPERAPESVEWLVGDVRRQRWGLKESVWQRLCNEVGVVFHLAAEVNNLKSFSELRATNLDSQVTILDLLGEGRPKQLHYASTLSVLVASDRAQGWLREGDDLSATCEVSGGYAQSKWAAEHFFRQRVESFHCYRYGLLTGDCCAHDFLGTFWRGLWALGAYPRTSQLQVDITPIDFAVRATLAASQAAATVYHVANPRSTSLEELVEALPGPLRALSAEEFFALEARTSEESLAQLALCRAGRGGERGLDLFQSTGVRFELARLEALGLSCPPVNAESLRRLAASAVSGLSGGKV